MQTNLASDNFCGYNQESAEFFYRFQDGQYNNNFVIGEVGIFPSSGTQGSYIRADAIDISSFLEGRDTILSRCNPPIPSLDTVNKENFEQMKKNNGGVNTIINADGTIQNLQISPDLLLQKFTKEKRSQTALDSIDYNRFDPGLKVDPQNLRTVIEDMWAQRGGLDTQNYIKSAWSNQNNVPNFNKQDCRLNLDPEWDCGEYCAPVNGYSRIAEPQGKPPGQLDYPFTGITSQQVVAVGAAPCGPQMFSGILYDQGYCPAIIPHVFKD